jgi:hypothetical protein
MSIQEEQQAMRKAAEAVSRTAGATTYKRRNWVIGNSI